MPHRCDATPDNLDDPNAQRSFHEKTDYFFKYFDPGILWNDYSIQSDVVVCFSFNMDFLVFMLVT